MMLGTAALKKKKKKENETRRWALNKKHILVRLIYLWQYSNRITLAWAIAVDCEHQLWNVVMFVLMWKIKFNIFCVTFLQNIGMHLNIDKLVNKNRDYYNLINSLNRRGKPYLSIKNDSLKAHKQYTRWKVLFELCPKSPPQTYNTSQLNWGVCTVKK